MSDRCLVYRGLKLLLLGRLDRGKFHQDILQSGQKKNKIK